jgi:single-strand DNA-binding protein
MNLNKVMLIGNLTRDPEVRQTGTGKNVASFAIATNMVWTDASGQKQERAEFTNVVAWGKLADICGRYLHKGSKAYVEGRLQTRDWTGKDGVKRYSTEVVIENMIMLDSRGGAPFTPSAPSAPTPSGDEISYDNNFGDSAAPAEEEIKVENIPF